MQNHDYRTQPAAAIVKAITTVLLKIITLMVAIKIFVWFLFKSKLVLSSKGGVDKHREFLFLEMNESNYSNEVADYWWEKTCNLSFGHLLLGHLKILLTLHCYCINAFLFKKKLRSISRKVCMIFVHLDNFL